jgi:hypothetical protein
VVEIKMPKELIGNMKYGQEEIETQADVGKVDDIS